LLPTIAWARGPAHGIVMLDAFERGGPVAIRRTLERTIRTTGHP
jgi:hypothetical protein